MSNLRSDCRDLVKDRAGGDTWRTHIERLCHQIDELESRWLAANRTIRSVREDLESIVCVEGTDMGVLLKSSESPTHIEEIDGRKAVVYDNYYFSDMGEALVAAHKKCVTD